MSYSYIPNVQSVPYPCHGHDTNGIPPPQALIPSEGAASTYNGIWTPAITPAGLAQDIDDPWSYNGSLLPLEGNEQQDSLAGLSSGSIDSTVSPYSRTEIQQADENDNHAVQQYDIAAVVESRRKARNKAAQRAFRERRKQHLQDVEAALHRLRKTAEALTAENQQLKGLLQKSQDGRKEAHASAATTRACDKKGARRIALPHHWPHRSLVTAHEEAVQPGAASYSLPSENFGQDMQCMQANITQHVPLADRYQSRSAVTDAKALYKGKIEDGMLSLQNFANAVLTLAVNDTEPGVSDSSSALQHAEDNRHPEPSGKSRMRPKATMKDRPITQQDEREETKSSLDIMAHQMQCHAELLSAQRAITTAGLTDYCTVLRL